MNHISRDYFLFSSYSEVEWVLGLSFVEQQEDNEVQIHLLKSIKLFIPRIPSQGSLSK